MMPPMNPPSVRKPRLKCTLGRRMMVQYRFRRSIMAWPRLFLGGLWHLRCLLRQLVGVFEGVADQRQGAVLGDMTLHAEIAPGRDLRQHLAGAVDVMRGTDRDGLRDLRPRPGMAVQAL